MVHHFPEVSRLAARARKAPLIVTIVIGLFLLATAAVIAGCCDYLGWPDGMMPPDRRFVIQTGDDGQAFRYDATQLSRSSITLQRNHAAWLKVIAAKDGSYEIIDSRGTGKVVLKIYAARH